MKLIFYLIPEFRTATLKLRLSSASLIRIIILLDKGFIIITWNKKLHLFKHIARLFQVIES